MPNRVERNKVWLIEWNSESADAHAAMLKGLGYGVIRGSQWNSAEIAELKNSPPSAVIVDLSRTPSRGRDVALAIRSHTAMLTVPIVLGGGSEEASSRVKRLIPDATATPWDAIEAAVASAIANPPRGAVKQSAFAAYAGTALPKKLGIKDGFTIALENAPPQFERLLSEMHGGIAIRRNHSDPRDLTLWFVTEHKALERGIRAMARHAEKGRLWIIWPKHRAGAESELSQTLVRKLAMAHGLVDFKISSIDETWSGLRFTIRQR